MRPERLAAAARAWQGPLLEQLALRSDAIGEALAGSHGLVAWDRQRVIGRAQRELWALREERFRPPYGGEPARVIERAGQPLECLAAVWRRLRQGRRVHVGAEAAACTAGLELLASFAPRLEGALTVEGLGANDVAARAWPEAGVAPALERVAVVAADGDRELAAYVLARASLRRGGCDPRRIGRALVCGSMTRLERHLQRLWVGARIGSAEDPEAFSGPSSPSVAAAFFAALDRWAALPEVEVLCEGGRLHRGGEGPIFLAPALLRRSGLSTRPLAAEPPIVGPMLVLYACPEEQILNNALEGLGWAPSRQLWVGAPPLGERAAEGRRYLRGALRVERVPPGLPDPRPV
ncbi:MAG: hypothetical protein IPK80_24990 [Nannocystis sp.]|nr:hypothetical protein [Nannocystis sp.]